MVYSGDNVMHPFIEYFLFTVFSVIPACGGVFTALTGSLHSPYYPDHYPHNKVCTYLIMAPSGPHNNIIIVTFTAFDVEDATSTGTCEYDYLAVSVFSLSFSAIEF